MAKVSVVIPLYNAQNYVLETIYSIKNQTYQDFDMVIVDDCSTDQSYNIIKNLNDNQIKLFQNQRNEGIAYTRNRAIELSTGEYIALMDDDDISPSYRLEHEVKYLEENPLIDIVGGHCRNIDSKGKDLNQQWNVYLNPNYIKAFMLFGNPIANSSALIRRSFLEKCSIKYKDNMYGAEDYFFWAECSLYGTIANLDEVMLYWRVNHGNETDRVFKNNLSERSKVIETIHNFLLDSYGFQITSKQKKILNKVFGDNGIIDNKEEVIELYQVLYSIVRQAEKLRLPHAKEVITMCRKRFGEKIGKAFFLWD